MICESCRKTIVDDAAYCPHCAAPVPGAPVYDDYEYEAFISYRHLPTDRTVAVKIQKALEGFVIPQQLRELRGGQKKLGRLFRDEDELPTASSLPDQIRDALIRSPYLIVVCSPQTRESQWVRREIELFASYHGRDRILIALAAGEPDESFPELLLTRSVVAADGTVSVVEEEPLAAEFRDLSRKKFSLEKLRLAAPLIGCGFDDLRQRQRARQQRTLLVATSAIAAVSLAFGSFSYYQQLQIRENYRQVQIKESEFLASESAELLDKADRYQAISVALAALPENSSSKDRPYVPSAQLALTNALGVYPVQSRWKAEYSIPDAWSHVAAFNDDGLMAFVGADRSVVVWDLRTGFERLRIDVEGELGLSPDSSYSPVSTMMFVDERLICVTSRAVACFGLADGELEWVVGFEAANHTEASALSFDGSSLAVFEERHYPMGSFSERIPHRVHILNTQDGTAEAVFDLQLAEEDSMVFASDVRLAFNGDATKLAFAHESVCQVIDVTSGATRQARTAQPNAASAKWVGERLVLTSTEKLLLGTGGLVCVEAFDANLAKLWEFSSSTGSSFDEQGASYTSYAEAIGSWRFEDTGQENVVVMLDRNLVFLNAETGEQAAFIMQNKPFSAARIVEIAEGVGIAACTGDGAALMKAPRAGSGVNVDVLTYQTQANVWAYVTVYDGCAYLVEWSSDPSKFSLYRYSDGPDLSSAEPVEALAGCTKMSWRGSEGFVGRYNEAIVVLDPNTFEEKVRIGADSLEGVNAQELGDLGVRFTEQGTLLLYGDKQAAEGGNSSDGIVFELQPETGELINRVELEGLQPDTYFGDAVSDVALPDGSSGFIAYDIGEIRLVPWTKPEQAQVIDPAGNARHVAYADGLLLVLESNVEESSSGYTVAGDYYTMRVYDAQTGELAESSINGQAPRMGLRDMFVVSEDGKLVAIACEDAKLRLFDIASGEMLWETAEASAAVEYLTFVPETNDVFVQDESGACILVSREDGCVTATSTVALGYAVDGCWALDDGRLAAKYRMRGLSDHTGLAIIEVRDGLLDPVAEVYNGFYATGDGSSALVIDLETDTMYKLKLHTLDELIEYARELIKGHELTEAERMLYRIGE